MTNSNPLSRIALRRDAVDDWDEYPFTVPAIRGFTSLDVHSRVLCFVGENGTGKSTLMEALADYCGFGLAGGSINMAAPLGRPSPVKRLADALQLVWQKRLDPAYFLRAESFTDIATYLDALAREDGRALRPYGGKSLHAQSHGESFYALFLHRISRGGLYLMDEPEAALSFARQLGLVTRIHDLLEANPGTQFIIATHSPILLAFPGAQLISFDGETVRPIVFQETDAYAIGSRFFANPQRYLERLLADHDAEP